MFKKTAEVVKANDNDKIGKYFLPNVQKEGVGLGRSKAFSTMLKTARLVK